MSRILFIITQSEMGGAQRYLLELAPYLASRGHEISVAAGEGDGELFEGLESRIKNLESRNYCINSLVRNLNLIKDALAFFQITKILKKERPDVVFLQSTKAGFLGSLAVKVLEILDSKFQILIAYRIGGWSFRDPRAWWMNKILFWMEKLSAPLKDKIIVNSEFDRQLAIEKKIAPADKIIKIYNGVDISKLKFLTKEKARNALVSSIKYQVSSNKNTMLIGTVANLYATKGIEYLIESARQLYLIPNTKYLIQFVVIGEGKERPKLEALIKKYNLEDSFFLVGRMPNATQYLKAFDIFVLPSVKEGFPWAVLETMASGVPIITTRVGAVPEVIEDEKEGLLVSPRSSKALAQKIYKLVNIQDTHDREYLVMNAEEKLKQFSLQKMLRESEEAIDDLTR